MPEEPATSDLAEITRRGIDAVNRRDFDTLMSYAAPDLVYDTSPSGFGVYEGLPAVRTFITGYWDTFEEFRLELEEFLDLGNGVTLAVARHHARPIGSTAPIRRTARRGTGVGGVGGERRALLASYEWGKRERKLARPWWHDDGEYVNSREDPDHATYRGVEAIEKLFTSWLEVYPDMRILPLEARGNGDWVSYGSASLVRLPLAGYRSRSSWLTS
jgi:hypothetical protein